MVYPMWIPESTRIPGPPGDRYLWIFPGSAGKVIERIFGIDPALDGMPPDADILLVELQGLSGCNRKLVL